MCVDRKFKLTTLWPEWIGRLPAKDETLLNSQTLLAIC